MAYLTISMPSGAEQRVMLVKPKIVIGRSLDADVAIDADWVSGSHAAIEKKGSQFEIVDLGSSNGTFVNYEKVSSRILKDNDLIFLGRSKILFHDGATSLEESSVELDIFNDEKTGVFTRAPAPTEVHKHPNDSPSPRDVVEKVLQIETSEIPDNLLQLEEDPPALRRQIDELQEALRQANLDRGELEVELDSQRRRAEQEIERLLGELTSWKSKYFKAIEDKKKS
jgi:pSer/pThr/pTyr-binding forkhead associated (FHA) protein